MPASINAFYFLAYRENRPAVVSFLMMLPVYITTRYASGTMKVVTITKTSISMILNQNYILDSFSKSAISVLNQRTSEGVSSLNVPGSPNTLYYLFSWKSISFHKLVCAITWTNIKYMSKVEMYM